MTSFDKPTGDDTMKRVAHLLRVWGACHEKWEKIDTYLNQSFLVWDSPYTERPSIHPARSRSILDHAVDNQLAFEPKVHRPPRGETEDAKEKADKIEPFVVAGFMEASLLEPLLTFKQVGRHLLSYGYTVVQGPLWNTESRPEEPKKERGESKNDFEIRMVLYENEKRTWMPYRIRAPHPSRVLLDPLEKKPSFAIVHGKRYAGEIAALLRGRKGRKDVQLGEFDADDPFEQIEVSEVFNQRWHGMFKGGDLLFLEKNKPQFVPFGHAFSGFGQEPTASPTGLDPSALAVGVLDPLLETLRAEAQALSSIQNALIEAAFPDKYTSGSAADLAAQQARGDGIKEVPGGKDSIWWEKNPELPEWLFRALALLEQDLELGSFSKQLAGIRETGVTTVGQQAILSTAAARKFVAPGKQIEHLATNIGSNMLRLLDISGETLTIRGHKLSPADLQHDYSLEVKFELIDPVLQMQERITSMNEHGARLLSDESYWSKTRLEDATGERRRLDEEDTRNLPMVKTLRQLQILRQWGLLTDEGLAAAEQQVLSGQIPDLSGLGVPQGLTDSVPGQPRTGGALGAVDPSSPL
ncbi:hypothetical protein LCGC14_0735960 [marine sediment metagenome]|uniref:Uncharacterized protein n=1 Tax=marine sediment metagenome TaxID=412755 RepID=A0A0F9QCA3_9ZZZZ